jgi:hypothetical protein
MYAAESASNGKIDRFTRLGRALDSKRACDHCRARGFTQMVGFNLCHGC